MTERSTYAFGKWVFPSIKPHGAPFAHLCTSGSKSKQLSSGTSRFMEEGISVGAHQGGSIASVYQRQGTLLCGIEIEGSVALMFCLWASSWQRLGA